MTRARSLSLLANANAFTVSGSNNVGIGSTLPDGKLDVDGDILVGTAITIGKVSGIISATSYRGDGSQLTGVDSSNLIDSGDTNRVAANTSGIVVTGIATVTGNMNVGGVLTYDDVTNVDSLGIITARSHVSIADSILHTGDTDTSIRFPAANTFTVETAGSERLRVLSDGSVRIGDNSIAVAAVGSGPTLGINGTAPEITLRDDASGNPYAVMRTNDFGSLTLEADQGDDASNSTIHFKVDNAEKMRITSGGSVGFNTTLTQSSKTVHIAGDYRSVTQNVADEGLIFQSFTTASTGDVYPGISWTGNPGALGRARASINAIATNDNAGSDLVFLTRNQADGTELDVTDDERLRITSGGLVGVNVTPTQQKLTIDVDSSGTTQASFDGINICNTNSTTNNGSAIVFGQTIAGNSNARIGVINSDRSGSSEDQDIFFGTLGGGSYAERLRIASVGDVIIKNPTTGGRYFKGIDTNGDEKILIGYETGSIVRIAESLRMDFGTTSLEPVTDNSVDLGQADKRWKNIYSADLQLSNEGSSNDVDGTWGQYTIQEGEDDLFLLNRRNGKTYKFVLEEVN